MSLFSPFAFIKQEVAAPAPSFDPDAQAFFTAIDNDGGSLTSDEKNAVNQLVLDLKAGDAWDSLIAAYPFVGSTVTEHKYNLKDPQDTDAAHRLTFNSSSGNPFTFSTANGAVPPSPNNNAFANTFLNPSASLAAGDMVGNHLAFYTTNDATKAAYDIGAFDNTKEYGLVAAYGNTTTYYNCGSGFISGGNLGRTGLFIGNNSGSISTLYQNNSVRVGPTSKTVDACNSALFLFDESLNDASRGGQNSERNMMWASIGNGMTSSSIDAYYNAVVDYQTTLGRNV
jgi:hypothetical protein